MIGVLVRRSVRLRADHRCEYCQLREEFSDLTHQIEHIIARQHSGSSDLDNLALACLHCNLHKGPNISGINPINHELVRLFHPRTDDWSDHFEFQGALVLGLTPIGRATVVTLAMNAEDQLDFRAGLIGLGRFP